MVKPGATWYEETPFTIKWKDLSLHMNFLEYLLVKCINIQHFTRSCSKLKEGRSRCTEFSLLSRPFSQRHKLQKPCLWSSEKIRHLASDRLAGAFAVVRWRRSRSPGFNCLDWHPFSQPKLYFHSDHPTPKKQSCYFVTTQVRIHTHQDDTCILPYLLVCTLFCRTGIIPGLQCNK